MLIFLHAALLAGPGFGAAPNRAGKMRKPPLGFSSWNNVGMDVTAVFPRPSSPYNIAP